MYKSVVFIKLMHDKSAATWKSDHPEYELDDSSKGRHSTPSKVLKMLQFLYNIMI